jgi:hypothetical protein
VSLDQHRCISVQRVLADRDVIGLVCGYAAVIWGAVGLRQWIVAFLDFYGAAPAVGSTPDWTMLLTGAVIGLLGVPAGLLGNELSIRFGLRHTALFMFLAAAATNGAFGLNAPAAVLGGRRGIARCWVRCAGQLLEPDRWSARRCRLAAYRGDNRGLFVHRCRRWFCRKRPVVRDCSRSVRRTSQITGWVVSFATCAVAGLVGAGVTVLLSRQVEFRESP